MDPTLYRAAKEGNIGTSDFVLADHLKRDEENGYQVTPLGNTVLHIAAIYGHSRFMGEVVKIVSGLLRYTNKKKETALHIAAKEGHSEVVSVLISKAGEEKERLMRMTDDIGDTALHKAVRCQHLDIVKLLVKEDPDFESPTNHARETPLYLAAEGGFHDGLVEILESCKKPNYAAGPSDRTPLHAAVVQEHTDCSRSLWQWNKSLCEEADKWGWNSLHYAVKLGLIQVVRDMIGWKKSLTYLRAGSENNWTTTIHIAVSEGDHWMIKELLEHCPDCWEMLNSNSQNILHVAILNNRFFVIGYLLNSTKCQNFIDEPDNDGNTPIHLLAASGYYNISLIEHHKATKMSFNKNNEIPLDLASSGTKTRDKEEVRIFLSQFMNGGRRGFNVNQDLLKQKNELKEIAEEAERKLERRLERKIETIMRVAQVHLVVATLLMTVTFTAGFTLPGGFDSDTGANKGMAILTRKTAFRAFVISDAIAFTCSAAAIFSYFAMAVMTEVRPIRMMSILLYKLYFFASIMQLLAMTAAVIAFVTGTYATLGHSVGLAATVCVICCISFPVYCWVLRQFRNINIWVAYLQGLSGNY